MADEKKAPEQGSSGKTVGDVFETLNEEQKLAVYAIIGQVAEDAKGGNNNNEEDN